MTEAQEKEIEKLNEGRLLREASRQLLPFLEKMREDVIARISRGQTAELTGLAAELKVIDQLRAKITRSNRETEMREGKLYATREREQSGSNVGD